MRPKISIRPVAPPSPDPAVAAPETGATLQITGAADGDQARPLFTGRLLRRQVGLWGSRLLIEEATGPLARHHVDKAIRNSTAAKLMQELCQEAGVQATVEPPGATLPAYALHWGPSGMDHILRLACMSGLLVRTDVEGRLHAETALPVPVETLRREEAVIEFQRDDGTGDSSEVRITGDGAMGSKGPGAEGWLLQSLDAVAAGEGGRTHHLAGLKTAADVARAATALTIRQKERAAERRILLAGLPPVDLGQVVLLTGFGPAPEPARLAAVTIGWDAGSGLVSRLELHGIGG